MEQVKLRAETGRPTGTRPARRLRREGLVPAVVYGREMEATSVAVNARDLRAALSTEAGYNALINLDVGDDEVLTVAREVQRHPVRGDIIHLDFISISLTETIEADVGLDVEGTPIGVVRDQGILETLRSSIPVEALPTNIPDSIHLDVSEMEVGDTLFVSDLPVIEGVEYLDDPTAAVVTVIASRVEEEPEVEEELELLEGELPEGEEPAAEASADDDSGDES